ncbi:hypothetical protein JXQ70_19740 [bacterium]|nr:hypothetical protein [bacterium]
MTQTSKKKIRIVLGCGSLILVVLFLTVCSIVGVNVRRTNLGQEFIEDIITERYDKAYQSLSTEYRQRFLDSIELFSLAGRFFEHAVFHVGEEGINQYRFHAQGPFFIQSYPGQRCEVTLLIIDSKQPRSELLKTMLLLYLGIDRVRSELPRIEITLLYQGERWTIDQCHYRDIVLDDQNTQFIISNLKTLTIEELLKYGQHYDELGDRGLAILFYQDCYRRLTEWDENARSALDHLADYWLETGKSEGHLLKKTLNDMSQRLEARTETVH